MRSIYGSQEIDDIIHNKPARLLNREGWINLAMAALDQAGLNSITARRVRKLVESYLGKSGT